jgi:hypothetical protein
MNETKYQELIFELIHGQKTDIIPLELREEVLKQTSDKFQQMTYDEYSKQFPENSSMDLYFFKQCVNSDKPLKELDYAKLDLITSRIATIKKELIDNIVNKTK